MNRQGIIVGIGEILWDLFPDAARFGGAPANFACHAAALGSPAVVVSSVGRDQLGDDAIKALRGHRVAADYIARSNLHPTGTVTIDFDEAGQPRYSFGQDEAWDHLEWSRELNGLAAQAAVVCFGTLAQRNQHSRDTILRFVEAAPAAALRIFDINLRPPFYSGELIQQSLERCNVLKLNDDELRVLAGLFKLSGTECGMLDQLARRFDLELVALTRGANGAVLMRGSELSECGAQPVHVVDSVGAGDSFSAVLATGLLRGQSLDHINRMASRIAAYVCSQPGATPALPSEMMQLD